MFSVMIHLEQDEVSPLTLCVLHGGGLFASEGGCETEAGEGENQTRQPATQESNPFRSENGFD